MADTEAEDRVEAMTRRIADLLETATGESFLAKLFWEALDYERVKQPIPSSVLPATSRSDVVEALLFARCDQLPVCYVKLLTSELSAKIQSPVLKALARAWPAVLTVFSNFGGNEWDFVWQSDDHRGKPFRLSVDRALFGPMELARQLYALKAYDLKTDEELPEAAVVEKVGRVFRRQPRRRRIRERLLRTSPLLREVGRWQLLSAAEEKQLRRQFAAGEKHPARDRLVYANLRLVLDIADDFRGRGVDWEDLVQEGCIGLMRAADKFEPERGFKFSTYATWWIWQRIQRAILEDASTVAVPVHLAEPVAAARNYWRDSFVSRGYAPTPEEVMKEVGMDQGEYRILRKALAARFGSRPLYRSDTGGPCAALTADEDDPSSVADRTALAEDVTSALVQLDARSAMVLRRRFGLHGQPEETLEEIGQDLNLTRERVRQIEANAIRRLQHPACGGRLESYVQPRHHR